MAKRVKREPSARPPAQGVDIGPKEVRRDGPVFPVKEDAEMTAKKNGGRVVEVEGGWQVQGQRQRR